MKTIFDEAGTGKEVQQRYAKLLTRHRKATDPAAGAFARLGPALAKVAATDRVHVVVAVAEHDSEPLFKADLSITSTVAPARTP